MIEEITVIGGHNKFNEKEDINISFRSGDIISIVGDIGSGKSRLLADIECIAQEDTITKRKVLINGETPQKEERYSIENSLVSQISKNSSFVMDLTVEDFILMHAETRLIYEDINKLDEVIDYANSLSGERFKKRTPLTQLSDGQSWALMFAEVALLSPSKIILIDGMENNVIALDLLAKKDKIIIMTTNDPILALMATKRIVIENGGIKRVIETTKEEKENLKFLLEINNKLSHVKNIIKKGDTLNLNIREAIFKFK